MLIVHRPAWERYSFIKNKINRLEICAHNRVRRPCKRWDTPQFDAFKVLVFEELDSIVKASSLVEMVNALIRPYLNSSKGQITQETLNLIMFYHNHRRYKSGRRQGKAPIELLTGEALQGDWVELLIQHKREASANANESSSPVLGCVPRHPGQTAPLEIPADEAVCEPSADADYGWQPTDVAAA